MFSSLPGSSLCEGAWGSRGWTTTTTSLVLRSDSALVCMYESGHGSQESLQYIRVTSRIQSMLRIHSQASINKILVFVCKVCACAVYILISIVFVMCTVFTYM